MKQLIFAIIIVFSFGDIFAQTEPRLVLPVGHTNWVLSAVFSPNGKLALTASWDKTARILDVATGQEH